MTTKNMTASRVEDHPSHKNDFTGSRAPGLLAKWPIIGLLMFIFGGLVFGALVLNLRDHGPLLEWDKVIANTLPAIALKSPPFVKVVMDAGFYIGDQVIVGLGFLLAIYFIIKRYWQELTMVAIGLVGASSLFLLLSNFFARPRPPTQIWILVNLPGFPSGHAITVVTFYGLVAYLLARNMASAFWKAFVSAVALFIIIFVGFSRIFTGGHYLTDVLAGYAVGIAWSGAIYTLIEIIFQKIRSHNVKKE